MVSFLVQEHSQKPGVRIVEILVNNKVAAVIYPEGDSGVKVVSAHFKGVGTDEGFARHVKLEDSSRSTPPIPSISIVLEPGPYKIQDGKIVRLNH